MHAFIKTWAHTASVVQNSLFITQNYYYNKFLEGYNLNDYIITIIILYTFQCIDIP